MPRRLIVVAEARLRAQIHKQAEQNKVQRRHYQNYHLLRAHYPTNDLFPSTFNRFAEP